MAIRITYEYVRIKNAILRYCDGVVGFFTCIKAVASTIRHSHFYSYALIL